MDQQPDHPAVFFNPVLLLATTIILTLIVGWLRPLPFLPEIPARIGGAILFFGGLLFGLPAFLGFLRAGTSLNPRRPSTALVEVGTFRLSRNPMYLGMLIAYAGLFIFLRSAWFLVLLPVLAWLMTIWVVIPEERYLEQKFGEGYREFAGRVPRWI